MNNKKINLLLIILLFISTLFLCKFINQKYGTSQNEKTFSLIERTEKYPYMYNEKTDGLIVTEMEQLYDNILIPNKTITIAATGDIMFHTPQIRSAFDTEKNNYDFYPMFKKIEPYIKSVDLAMANFETVVAGDGYRYTGYPTFNSPEETLTALKNVGFDILSTANNHSLDRGKIGIINTIDSIIKYDMENIGTYKEKQERVVIKDIKGIKLGLISYTYGCNGLEGRLTKEELDTMINIIDEEKLKEDIQKADFMGADVTLVYIHWGNEYQLEPSLEQEKLGKKMIDWGADIILGSHPHVIQKSEIIKHNGNDKFIIYSMGNFISNQRRETLSNRNRIFTEDGIIVVLELEKDEYHKETIIKGVNYIPTWVNRYSKSGKLLYEILPTIDYLEKSEENLSQEVNKRIEKSYQQTIDKMAY